MRLKLSSATLSGQVRVPSSKSAMHRALICAAQAEGTSTIHGIVHCDDAFATKGCLTALGARFYESGDVWRIAGGLNAKHATLDCIESGSTLRFMAPLAPAVGGQYTLTGSGRLMSRPMDELMEALQPDITFENQGNNLKIAGKLTQREYILKGNISSQYASGIMMALPLIGGSGVYPGNQPVSGGYVRMTESMLNTFGANVMRDEFGRYHALNRCEPQELTLEGDWSQSAFYFCAGMLGADVSVSGLNPESAQGDKAIIDILKAMGGSVIINGDGIKMRATHLVGATIDASGVPDLVPVLASLATLAEGTTVITGAAHLRAKESDRLSAMATELNAIGGDIHEIEDGLIIHGRECLTGGTVDAHGDHRVAMALSIAALGAKGNVILNGAQHVKKSYPNYWDEYRELGGVADEC